MADDGSKDTKQSDRSEKASTHYTIEWVRGMPSLIVGIQRRKASIRTPFAARFHHSPSSTEGRHVPAPVGGCRRPHDHRRTAVVPEPPCTTSTTSTILHHTTRAQRPNRPLRPERQPPSGVTVTTAVPSRGGITLDSTLLAGFRWRNIGPANMMGRVSSVTGIPSPSRTFFVAAAAGGIWKTTNAGTTFRPVFDNERCVSMGELAIAPSDTTQVWAGTGEEDSRNTIAVGCGIFKSADGELTWKRVGLEKS